MKIHPIPMKKAIFLVLTLTAVFRLTAQTVYTGTIGDYPVEMVIDAGSGSASAVYAYTNFDEPIPLDNGVIKNGKLTFHEKDKKQIRAILTFDNYSNDRKNLTGIWKNNKTQNELKITLSRKYIVENGKDTEWKNIEILQPVSSGNKYFKAVLSKEKDQYYPQVSSIKVFEKRTDKLLQQLNTECQFWGLNNLEIDDYNFDGVNDLSVFEASYAGPNTSRVYFLYDKKTQQYHESSFSGISLEFDHVKKRVYERNQCCAGTIVTTAEYKVIKNNMVLLSEHCFRWSDKKQELTERKMKECQ
ncbi:hypothetical protein BAX95_08510 [Elizabethkingia meningoseptica]|nr:hypothetical protein BAX95_08510 [Elizabethkingia meningoseptica]